MIAPYKIHKEVIEDLDFEENDGEVLLQVTKESDIEDELSLIICPPKGIIDGDMLQRKWFPEQGHFDVFISHAHEDRETAEKLASYLYRHCGYNCFIDSNVWNSADQLHSDLDDTYSLAKDGHVDYRKSQYSSSHVHSMLTMAIMDMIDQCDFFIFIESGYSLDLNSIKTHDRTFSPWLYDEINIANRIRRKEVGQHLFSEGTQPINESQLRISRAVDTKSYKALTKSFMEGLVSCNGDRYEANRAFLNLYKPTFSFRQRNL